MSVQRLREDGLKPTEISRMLVKEGYEDVLVLDIESADQKITPRREELYEHILTNDEQSVSEIAEALERDVSAVSRDLDELFELSMVDVRREGKKKIPSPKHEYVVLARIF